MEIKAVISNGIYTILDEFIPTEISDADEFSLYDNTKFTDIGMDSLALRELVFKCESEFEINIPDAKASDCNTVGEFVELCTAVFKQKYQS